MGRLKHGGSSVGLRRTLFPQGFGAEVMLLVLDTWRGFKPNPSVRQETRITALFHKALIDAYEAAGRNWFVVLEDFLVDDTDGSVVGRNDINFYPPPLQRQGQTVFFTVECKRLRVRYPASLVARRRARRSGKSPPRSKLCHLTDAYVKYGMLRFVREAYSRGLPCGGMLGYVMDNRVRAAFVRLRREIRAQHRKLRMKGPKGLLSPSTCLPAWRYSADTIHRRSDGEFTLHHLLVGLHP